MITAWDVYWVMQLDSIIVLAALAMIVGGVAGAVMTLYGTVEDEPAAARMGKRALAVAAVAAVVMAFAPSSKTAAAMIVLPALTSEAVTEPLAKEAAELYGLAKKALAEVAEGDPKEPAE